MSRRHRPRTPGSSESRPAAAVCPATRSDPRRATRTVARERQPSAAACSDNSPKHTAGESIRQRLPFPVHRNQEEACQEVEYRRVVRHQIAGGHLEERREGQQRRGNYSDPRCRASACRRRISSRIQRAPTTGGTSQTAPTNSPRAGAIGWPNRMNARPVSMRVDEQARVEEVEGAPAARRGRQMERGQDLRLEHVRYFVGDVRHRLVHVMTDIEEYAKGRGGEQEQSETSG